MILIVLILATALSGGCKVKTTATLPDTTSNSAVATTPASLTVTSNAFTNASPIPKRYSCEGENISPALAWDKFPVGTKSFALVCEDPDAPRGTFIHWVIYNIPPTEHGLAENVAKKDSLPNGTRQGVNGTKQVGYMGPCPPPGKPHRYFFKLFALDAMMNMPGTVTHDDLLTAIKAHILGEGEIMGTYQR